LEQFPLLQEEVHEGFSPGFMSYSGIHAIGLSKADLLVKAPNYFAIYATLDLRSLGEFEDSYNYVKRVSDDFALAVNALAERFRKEKDLPVPSLRISTDFLFDYECQFDFAQDGVLQGSEPETAVGGDAQRAAVVKWLRLQERSGGE